MGMVELFVPLGAFMLFAAIVGLITRMFATVSLNRTIREAMRSDPASVPVLADRLDRHPPWGDALLGVIFIALAVAMVLLGLTEHDPEQRQDILRATIVPFVVGLTVLIYTWYAARKSASR